MAIISAWVAVFIPGHLYGWLIERSYVLLLVMVAIASLYTSRTSPRNFIGRGNNIILFGLLVITILYVTSTIVTATTSSSSITIRDLLDLLRYMAVGAVFIIMGNADADRLRSTVDKLIFVSLTFSLMILFLYIVDVPVMSDIAHWLYQDTKTAISFPRWVRLSAPFENPNFLAFYAVLCLAYSLFFTYGKRKYLIATLALIVLVATGSRSGWVSTFMLFFGLLASITYKIFSRNPSILRKDARFLIVLVFLISCLLWLLYPYFLESIRVQMVINALEDGGITYERNVAGRIDMFVEALKLFSQRPIFGWGPLKGGGLDVIDNQYLLVLARQGVVGFAFLTGVILYVFNGAVKSMHTRTEKYGVIFMLLAVMVMLMTGAFFNNFRLFVLFMFFVVASTGQRKRSGPRAVIVQHAL